MRSRTSFMLHRTSYTKTLNDAGRTAAPGHDLTWERELGGGNFIAAADRLDMFGTDKNILEVGPGYGRLLTSLIEAGIEYNSYVGIDISQNQVDHLNEKFADDRHTFIQGDIQSIDLQQSYDTLISSLTFKHLFPSCKSALKNLHRYMTEEGCILIDFIEGERRFFETDDVTYIRQYSRQELTQLFEEAGFSIAQFEQIEHMPWVYQTPPRMLSSSPPTKCLPLQTTAKPHPPALSGPFEPV